MHSIGYLLWCCADSFNAGFYSLHFSSVSEVIMQARWWSSTGSRTFKSLIVFLEVGKEALIGLVRLFRSQSCPEPVGKTRSTTNDHVERVGSRRLSFNQRWNRDDSSFKNLLTWVKSVSVREFQNYHLRELVHDLFVDIFLIIYDWKLTGIQMWSFVFSILALLLLLYI